MTTLLRLDANGAGGAFDLVFVHGLGGEALGTWGFVEGRESWRDWLARDHPGARVWSLDYDAAASAWQGSAMPLTDRAANVLPLLQAHGLGERPLVFVAHSMGGLLVKQLLRRAESSAREYGRVLEATRGVVFLSTPHAGSPLATIANILRLFLRANVTIEDLRRHDPHLRELNAWYRNNSVAAGVRSLVFFETQTTKGVLVVDPTSADPGITDVTPIPVDSDHLAICKPERPDALVWLVTSRFITDLGLAPVVPPAPPASVAATLLAPADALSDDERSLVLELYKYGPRCKIAAARGEFECLWVPGALGIAMQWGWERHPEEQAASGKVAGSRDERLKWIFVAKDLLARGYLVELGKKNLFELSELGTRAGLALKQAGWSRP